MSFSSAVMYLKAQVGGLTGPLSVWGGKPSRAYLPPPAHSFGPSLPGAGAGALAWTLAQPGRAEKSRSPLALGWEVSLCSSMGPRWESELVCTTEQPQAALPS